MGTLRLGSSVVVPSVTINGGSQPVIDPLSITPTTSQQTITAPSGTDGYSPITVSAVTSSIDANITSSNIKSGVTILGVNGSVVELDGEQINITPTTSQQVITPTSPKNAITQATVSAVTSSIDANITAENIKKDVEILGVTGIYEGSGGSTNILKSVVADGKTELSGTPTPSNPINITCNNGVLTKTANEANYISSNVTLGYWLRNTDGQPESSSANFYTNMMPVKPNTSYVAFGRNKDTNVISGYNCIAWYDSTGTWIRNSTYTQGTPGIDTSPSNAAYARFHCNIDGTSVTQELVDSFNWTFCEGNQEVAYVPFLQTIGTPETITDNDGNIAKVENLFKINDTYIDVQDIFNGRITRKIGIKVLDGTENWQLATAANLVQFYTSSTQGIIANNVSLISTIAPYGCIVANRTQYDFGCFSGGTGNLCFQMKGSATLTTVSAWTQYLTDQYTAGTPVIVIYPLTNSTTEIVNPQVLVHSPVTVAGSLQNLIVNTTVYDYPIHYVEKRMVKINNVNTLTNSSPSGTSVPVAPISLKNVQNIDNYVFEDSHYLNPLISPRIGFINSEDLRYITGNKACYRTFDGSNIVKTGLNYVEQITGEDACNSTFYNCTSLIDAGLERLVTIGASDHTTACQYMFYGDIALEKVDFKMLSSVGGNLACRYMFAGCTNLKELIYQSYINNSSTSSNIFNNMLQGVTGCTVHFPLASSNMSSWSDVIAGFGGTNTTILFDIIRICTIGDNSYVRSPLDSVGDAIAFKLNTDPYTIGYSIGEPNSGGYLYTTPECTTPLGLITLVS